jgi:hypothetical protein
LKKTVETQILAISIIMGGLKNSNYRYVDRNKPSYIAIKIKLVQNYLWENNLSKIKERKLKLLIICHTSKKSSDCNIFKKCYFFMFSKIFKEIKTFDSKKPKLVVGFEISI